MAKSMENEPDERRLKIRRIIIEWEIVGPDDLTEAIKHAFMLGLECSAQPTDRFGVWSFMVYEPADRKARPSERFRHVDSEVPQTTFWRGPNGEFYLTIW
jgi:hypothetical protein